MLDLSSLKSRTSRFKSSMKIVSQKLLLEPLIRLSPPYLPLLYPRPYQLQQTAPYQTMIEPNTAIILLRYPTDTVVLDEIFIDTVNRGVNAQHDIDQRYKDWNSNFSGDVTSYIR